MIKGPYRAKDFKLGQLVRTPLGRIAKITAISSTGEHLMAEYVGDGRWVRETILQPAGLVKLDRYGNEL